MSTITEAKTMRVYEIARILGKNSKVTLQGLWNYGITWPMSPSSAIPADEAFTFIEWITK